MKILLILILLSLSACSLSMPGKSFHGPLPEMTEEQIALAKTLEHDVRVLSVSHGERNIFNQPGLRAAEDFITSSLKESGYQVRFQEYESSGVTVRNIEAEILGTERPSEVFLIGAHYDGVHGSLAANDNGSGVAATLALARALKNDKPARSIRFVFFVNEEPPFFWTEDMGSVRSAKSARERGDRIVAMWSLETLGYYTEEKNSQNYPAILSWFYPSRGNFVAFVGMSHDSDLIHCTIKSFRENSSFPSEGAALPWLIPHVGSSDHWSFWKQGYPSLMITDTAMYRYHYYHTDDDCPSQLNYPSMARVVSGLIPVARDISRVDSISSCDLSVKM